MKFPLYFKTMNKVTYTKIKRFNIFGKNIFKTIESYTEYSEDDIEEDLPPIQVTQDYYNQEFDIDNNNNKQH